MNFPDMPGYFRAGHTGIQDVNGLLFYSFINLRADFQNFILFSRRISYKNIQGSIFKHNISYLVCHFPQIVFRASINNDHQVHVSRMSWPVQIKMSFTEADHIQACKFDRHGQNTPIKNKRHIIYSLFNAIKRNDHRPQKNRFAHHLNNGSGDHSQCPLGANKQIHQVITRRIFDKLTAGMDDLPIGQDDFQPPDIIAYSAVFYRPAASGISGDHSPEHSPFISGMRRKIKSLLFDLGNKLAQG